MLKFVRSSLLLIFAVQANAALADLVSDQNQPPFGPLDRAIIERNEKLKLLATTTPWIVFSMVKAIQAQKRSQKAVLDDSASPNGKILNLDGETSKNPDLDFLERTAPEAAHDLFLLMKEVGKTDSKKAN